VIAGGERETPRDSTPRRQGSTLARVKRVVSSRGHPALPLLFAACANASGPTPSVARDEDTRAAPVARPAEVDAGMEASSPAPAIDSGAVAPAETRDPSEALVTMSRTACNGFCPVYTVRLFTDGLVTYEGEQFVRERGARSKRIDPHVVRDLVAEARRAAFLGAKPCYPSRPGSASIELRVRVAPKARPVVEIRHDTRCTTAKAAEFAEHVDERTESRSWVTCSDADPAPCRSY
jgi:hypothetical protein